MNSGRWAADCPVQKPRLTLAHERHLFVRIKYCFLMLPLNTLDHDKNRRQATDSQVPHRRLVSSLSLDVWFGIMYDPYWANIASHELRNCKVCRVTVHVLRHTNCGTVRSIMWPSTCSSHIHTAPSSFLGHELDRAGSAITVNNATAVWLVKKYYENDIAFDEMM